MLEIPMVVSWGHGLPYQKVCRHGENGYLAWGESDWLFYLSQLIDDAALRWRLGQAARRDVVERHSAAAQAACWKRAFDEALQYGMRPLVAAG